MLSRDGRYVRLALDWQTDGADSRCRNHVLVHQLPGREQSSSDTVLPFRLVHLHFYNFPPPQFLDTLLQPTVTSLSLWPSLVEPIHTPSLAQVADQLISLDCSYSWVGFSHLQPFFRCCSTLYAINIAADDAGSVLPLIPRVLETLTCGGSVSYGLETLLTLFRAAPTARPVALSSLRYLRFE